MGTANAQFFFRPRFEHGQCANLDTHYDTKIQLVALFIRGNGGMDEVWRLAAVCRYSESKGEHSEVDVFAWTVLGRREKNT